MWRLVGDVVDENYPLALGLDFIGACLYSAGLVRQRYSLSYPSSDGTAWVLGCRMWRTLAWEMPAYRRQRWSRQRVQPLHVSQVAVAA
jgi:hypothetical protein